ncbi:MAG: hypothetical protein PHU34_03410 [Candidatus Methanoperedens sp.]|nr:hypothetical protein [Candidatus Methanoperedens sp.]
MIINYPVNPVILSNRCAAPCTPPGGFGIARIRLQVDGVLSGGRLGDSSALQRAPGQSRGT